MGIMNDTSPGLGREGNTYAWTIAVLPYIEQNPLYERMMGRARQVSVTTTLGGTSVGPMWTLKDGWGVTQRNWNIDIPSLFAHLTPPPDETKAQAC